MYNRWYRFQDCIKQLFLKKLRIKAEKRLILSKGLLKKCQQVSNLNAISASLLVLCLMNDDYEHL